MKIACYERRLLDIDPGCHVKVLPHGTWYRVTSIIGNVITAERWLKSKNKWNRDHAVVIPRRKIFYVVNPINWEEKGR